MYIVLQRPIDLPLVLWFSSVYFSLISCKIFLFFYHEKWIFCPATEAACIFVTDHRSSCIHEIFSPLFYGNSVTEVDWTAIVNFIFYGKHFHIIQGFWDLRNYFQLAPANQEITLYCIALEMDNRSRFWCAFFFDTSQQSWVRSLQGVWKILPTLMANAMLLLLVNAMIAEKFID